MNFHRTLYQHYNAVSARLNDLFVNKVPWHTPYLTLIWWTPQVYPVCTHIPGMPLTLQIIISGITHEHGISWEDIIGHYRHRQIIRARQHLYYAAMHETKISGNSLSKYFQRDHATVIHGAAAHAKRHSLEFPRQRQIRMQRKMGARNNKGRFMSKEIATNGS